jgi:hypothetical protein
MRQAIVLVWRGDLMVGGLTAIGGASVSAYNHPSPLDNQEEYMVLS